MPNSHGATGQSGRCSTNFRRRSNATQNTCAATSSAQERESRRAT